MQWKFPFCTICAAIFVNDNEIFSRKCFMSPCLFRFVDESSCIPPGLFAIFINSHNVSHLFFYFSAMEHI